MVALHGVGYPPFPQGFPQAPGVFRIPLRIHAQVIPRSRARLSTAIACMFRTLPAWPGRSRKARPCSMPGATGRPCADRVKGKEAGGGSQGARRSRERAFSNSLPRSVHRVFHRVARIFPQASRKLSPGYPQLGKIDFMSNVVCVNRSSQRQERFKKDNVTHHLLTILGGCPQGCPQIGQGSGNAGKGSPFPASDRSRTRFSV